MTRYAVLIDHGMEGLGFVMRDDDAQYPDRRGRRSVVHEVDTITEALVLAADNSFGSSWEIVERINMRTGPKSIAARVFSESGRILDRQDG